MKPVVGLNALHRRVGQTHPRAVLSDQECQLLRELYASGRFSLAQLAEKFAISKSQVWRIVTGRQRWEEPVDWR